MINFFKNKSNNEQGIVGLIVVILLIIGIISGVYLVQTRTNFLPKAFDSASGPIQTSPSPVATQPVRLTIVKSTTPSSIGQEDFFEIYVSSPIDLINLVSAKLNFTSDKFEVTGIEINNTIFNQTIDKFFDNTNGTIWIVTGIEKNGIKDSGGNSIKVATVKFRVKENGVGTATFNDQSKVIRSSDSRNIYSFINTPPYTISDTTISPPVVPISCSPKPALAKEEVMTPQGLKVTIKATTNNTTPTNRIKSLNFFRFENATVTIGTQRWSASFFYATPSTDNSVTFYINQVTLNRSTFVELKVADICGEQSQFIGRDATAGWPTVIPPVPQPSTTPAPIACKLTKAEWIVDKNPAESNTTAGLRVEATGSCDNQQVSFTVLEDDGTVLGTDTVIQNPQPVLLIPNPIQSNFVAKTTWTTEFQEDGVFGTGNPPEYKFTARLNSGNSLDSANPELQVLREAGKPSPIEGDMNGKDGLELGDLSWLLSHLGPIKNELVDYNKDGELNNFDRSYLIALLRQNGILRPVDINGQLPQPVTIPIGGVVATPRGTPTYSINPPLR